MTPIALPHDAAVDLSVILVNYNTRDMTLRCIHALMADLGGITTEIIVVDNASTDGSVDAIRAEFSHIQIIASPINLGFGRANNRGMKISRGRYILLLNTDAFIKPGAVAALLDHLRHHPEAGLVGPRLLNGDGTLQISCYRYPSPFRAWVENFWLSALWPSHPLIGDYRRWAHNQEAEVDWIVGACMLLRREVYERTGGFDETFFMYAEESDWQKRILNEGFRIDFTPAAQVVHLGGASGKNEKVKINKAFFESLDYYEKKHHGLIGLMLLRIAMVIGSSLRLILWAISWLIRPARRTLSRQKMSLHRWLIWRQLTCWRLLKPEAGV